MDRLFLVGRPNPSHRFDSLLPASRLFKLNGFTSGGLESLRSPFWRPEQGLVKDRTDGIETNRKAGRISVVMGLSGYVQKSRI